MALYSARLNAPIGGAPYFSGQFTVAGVVNQEQDEGAFQSTAVHSFRGIRYHSREGAVFRQCTPEQINGLPWPAMGSGNKTAISIWE